MDVHRFLESLHHDPRFAGQLSHVEILPRREAQYGTLQRALHPAVEQLLTNCRIDHLYTHQVDAIRAARKGQPLVVVTGTASGKTLCYNLPILEACFADADARALYLFPTKALAQDQFKGLLQLAGDDEVAADRIRPGVYDGDTPPAQRKRIKAEANLVLSNPDMLHASILPYHPKWARFFGALRFVVLDEVHTYRGILGANVACLIRRLRRVCRHYGADPVFLAASATIANPGELTSRVIGQEVVVIDNDGSPRGPKYFALWNPTQETHTRGSQNGAVTDRLSRRSATEDAVWLFTAALRAGAQCLTFARTRQAAELICRYAQDELRKDSGSGVARSDLADAIRAYRGGYLPGERRQIEKDLFSGQLRGVASTNALELGIDVGSLDVSLLVNYPGTIASTWQQAGRSGRRHDESLTVLLAGNDPVDQYLLRHPDYFFGQSPESAVVDPSNPYVLANHLKSAAFELPLDEADVETFGEIAASIADCLAESNELSEIDGKFYSAAGNNPAIGVSLRHMSNDTFSIVLLRDMVQPQMPGRLPRRPVQRLPRLPQENRIVDSPRDQLPVGSEVIANVDAISAPELIYPEAVYLHNGESYFVRELDLDGKVAYVQRHEMDYYTQAILESHVSVTDVLATSSALDRAAVRFGEVDVRWKTVAFKKIKFSTRENVGFGSVDIPAQTLPTTAFALSPDDRLLEAIKARKLRPSEALCGIRNLAIVALPIVAMCDSRDISGVVDSKNFGRTTMIVYDRYPGGLGYAEKGYELIVQLLRICLDMVSGCDCEDGCPSCVGLPNLRPAIHSDPDLMRGYPIPDKEAAQVMLELLLEASDGKATDGTSVTHHQVV
jgi:DEAD/DEAH box helicase domain-containing protein